MLALTRQNLPQLRTGLDADNICAAGAYEIAGPGGPARCLDLRHRLGSLDRGRCRQADRRARRVGARGLGALLRIVPARCRPTGARPSSARRRCASAVEAAVRQGWDEIIGSGRRVRRHVLIRRQRALQGPLQAFRDHPGSGREGGIGQAREGLTALDKAARNVPVCSGWVALHTAPICATYARNLAVRAP